MIEKQEKNLNKQKTLAIIKPDAIKKGLISEIISRINKAGLDIIACKMEHLSQEKIEEFYSIHSEKPFFRELVDFMLSGHVMLMVLHGENAVNIYRNIMGDTNPKNAAKGTIRGDLADSIDANCVHGSDSVENAKIEISLMFNDNEIFG